MRAEVERCREVLAALAIGDVDCDLRGVSPDLLGQVYAQSLAETKRRGVYYTPRFIVDYVVERTVGVMLRGRTPMEPLRVVDPACGSGAFLLGVLRALLAWQLKWFVEHEPARWGDAVCFVEGEWRLTAARRAEIINNWVYGVDIDAQAVKVARAALRIEAGVEREGCTIRCGDALGVEWEAEFPEVRGFDVVVGNPPYVRIHRIPHGEADRLYARFKMLTSKADLSVAFIEMSLGLVREGGCVGMICTSQWLTADYGREIRRALAGRVREIVDFGSVPVFKGVNAYSAIVIVGGTEEAVAVRRLTETGQLDELGIAGAPVVRVSRRALSEAPWRLGGVSLAERLTRDGLAWRPLRDLGKAHIGVKSGLAAAFVVDDEAARGLEPELLLPYAYQGSEVERFKNCVPRARIIYPYSRGPDGEAELIPEAILRREFPRVVAHLSRYAEALRGRMDSRRRYAAGAGWYRLLRPGAWRYIDAEKLIIKGISKGMVVGVLAAGAAFDGANCPGVIFEGGRGGLHRNYFLAVLNSSVMSDELRATGAPKRGGHVRFGASGVSAAPIRALDLACAAEREVHDRIVGWVDELLKNGTTPARAGELERAIDAEVRGLYAV